MILYDSWFVSHQILLINWGSVQYTVNWELKIFIIFSFNRRLYAKPNSEQLLNDENRQKHED